MRSGRQALLASVVLAALALACNVVTGAGDLGVGNNNDLAGDPDSGETVSPQPTPTTTTSSGGPNVNPPRDAGPAEAGAVRDAATIGDATTPPPDVIVPPPPPQCRAGNTGIRYGTTATGEKWTSKNGALAPTDGQWAHSNGDNPNALVVTGFTFNIPASSRIDGIVVEIHRTTEGPVTDGSVSLGRGSSKANGAWPERGQNQPYLSTTYGSATDLWGTSWSVGDFANLQLSLVAKGLGDGHVDAMGVTVHYCAP